MILRLDIIGEFIGAIRDYVEWMASFVGEEIELVSFMQAKSSFYKALSKLVVTKYFYWYISGGG